MSILLRRIFNLNKRDAVHFARKSIVYRSFEPVHKKKHNHDKQQYEKKVASANNYSVTDERMKRHDIIGWLVDVLHEEHYLSTVGTNIRCFDGFNILNWIYIQSLISHINNIDLRCIRHANIQYEFMPFSPEKKPAPTVADYRRNRTELCWTIIVIIRHNQKEYLLLVFTTTRWTTQVSPSCKCREFTAPYTNPLIDWSNQ